MKSKVYLRCFIAFFALMLAGMNAFSQVTPNITGPNDPFTNLPVTLTGAAGQVQGYKTESGMTNYQWVASAAGTVTGFINSITKLPVDPTKADSIVVTWNAPGGQQSVSVSYVDQSNIPSQVGVLIINWNPFLGPIDPLSVPKFIDPMPHFAAKLRVNAKDGGPMTITTRPIKQVALSTGTVLQSGTIGPATPLVGVGNYAGYEITYKDTVYPAMWPARTIEAGVNSQLTVHYVNALDNIKYSDFNILADKTLLQNGYPDIVKSNPLTTPYDGPIPMVVHLHGGEMPSNSDGGPTAWFMPGGYIGDHQVGPGFDQTTNSISTYPNKQEEGTLWYHPHDQGLTRINVYTGLAGYYFLRGQGEQAAMLPGWSGDDKVQEVTPTDIARTTTFNGANTYLPEVELAIQDRMFNTNGGLYWPVEPTNPDIHPYWTPEFFGDVMTVNGKSWPYMSVAPRKYRFRMLDGCNARFLNLWLANATGAAPVISVIGSDGNMLDYPAILDPASNQTLLMAPGERYDVIIDFSTVPANSVLTLMNNAAAPYPTGTPADINTTGQIMQFVVNGLMKTRSGDPGIDKSLNFDVATNLRIGNSMVKLVDFTNGKLSSGVTANVSREIILNEVTGAGGPAQVLFNNSHFDANSPIVGAPQDFGGPTEFPLEGTTELISIANTTVDAHPIHIHLMQWQLVSRQDFNTDGYMTEYNKAWANNGKGYPIWPAGLGYPGGSGSPYPYNTLNTDGAVGGNPAFTPFLLGAPIYANPEERVWKDDVKAFPGQVTTYIMRAAPTSVAIDATADKLMFPFDPSVGPGYVWHCHIIDHEDMDMMRPLIIKPSVLRYPQIAANQQPQPVNAIVGAAVNFTVAASNFSFPTDPCKWQLSLDDGFSWTDLVNNATYSGVTTTTLRINAAALTQTMYKYRALLTNVDGLTISNSALLTVREAVPTAHFTPIWTGTGNGLAQENFYATLAKIDGIDLQPGDEIGIFDGSNCVGVGKLTAVLDGSNPLDIRVIIDDPATPGQIDGYVAGNPATFKIWNTLGQKEVANTDIIYILGGNNIFTNNASVSFRIGGFVPTNQATPLLNGWNIFSLYVTPDNTDMQQVVKSLIDDNKLVKVQNESGAALEQIPGTNIWANNIGSWQNTEGYKIKVNATTSLLNRGLPIHQTLPIPLSAGWNIASYPVSVAQDAMSVLNGLAGFNSQVKVQNQTGKAIENIPGTSIMVNNIGNFNPGEGYKIRVPQSTTLTINPTWTAAPALPLKSAELVNTPVFYQTIWQGNGVDHMNFYLTEGTAKATVLKAGNEIGIFDGPNCVGAAVIGNNGDQFFSFVASADDPTTDDIDGFVEGHTPTFKVWDPVANVETTLEALNYYPGSNRVFEPMATAAIGLKSIATGLNNEFGEPSSLGNNYPNPFNGETTIPFVIGNETAVDISVYDMLGKKVTTLIHGTLQAGNYTTVWKANGESKIKPGVYVYKMYAGDHAFAKLMVVQ